MAIMTIIPYKAEVAHWYAKDGSPCWSVIGKNGKERKPALADARPHGWCPGVTSLLKLWPAPSLKNWLRGQDIMAGATTPRLPDESDEVWVDKVLASADEEAALAADKGRRRHVKCAEIARFDYDWTMDDEDRPFLNYYLTWFAGFQDYTATTETPFCNIESGYGGTIDLMLEKDGELIIVDIKNRKKPAVYDTDCMQLVAYHVGCPGSEKRLLSVILPSETPGPPLIKEWTQNERAVAWQRFSWCLTGWRMVNNYDPRA